MTATKAWTGAIREPSNYKESNDPTTWSPPSADLELAFVYGYRSQDVRSNCFYGSVVSEVLYPTAALGIVYDSVKHKQRYNTAHTDDIISMASYPKNNLVATGRCFSVTYDSITFFETDPEPSFPLLIYRRGGADP